MSPALSMDAIDSSATAPSTPAIVWWDRMPAVLLTAVPLRVAL